MRYFAFLIVIIATMQLSVAPPVNEKKTDEEDDKENEIDELEQTGDVMEYGRYLMEVVGVLESDPDFRAKLKNADNSDIRSGKIADQLQFVHHNVRTRLDEIKRKELERLRHLATKEMELQNGLDVKFLKIAEHLDHDNARTFEIQDLKKLIAKITKDLAEVDKKRRKEFKLHEMEKKFEEEEKLKNMDNGERKKYEEELQAMKEKRKQHEPVHHPGSKQQLEEVWERQDHMDREDFNPRTFFFFHDVDGNGVWDQDEVKVLFLKELDKLYDRGALQGDLSRRAEEMERMREHLFNEADLNKDGLISYEEFVEQTRRPDFQQDEGWQPLDEQQIYTEEEFKDFQNYKQKEMEKLIARGMFPQYAHHPVSSQEYVDPRGSNQNLPHQQQFQDQNHPQYYQQQQVVSQQQYPNRVPVQPVHANIPQQYPDLSQHPQFQGELPLNQQHQQVPQQQGGQIPVQQQTGQIPVPQQGEQIPVQQQPQIPVKQNTMNQVLQSNPELHLLNPSNSNSQPVHGLAQQNINRNKIQTGEKV
ncbi:nucleobindin 1 isoform X2 [Ptiloglossa arizonensis]|uniref:nucleobindin 1 isoform X2 n=1 Tax=Ptiloglossa arizonensis TaxID=3350558 RepID=UPI003FA10646